MAKQKAKDGRNGGMKATNLSHSLMKARLRRKAKKRDIYKRAAETVTSLEEAYGNKTNV